MLVSLIISKVKIMYMVLFNILVIFMVDKLISLEIGYFWSFNLKFKFI